MAIFDTISFPPTDFVTGNPTIDGWTDNEDPGVVAHFPESGYATGGRVAFGGGSLVPPVSFQCTQVQVTSGADVGLPSVAAGSYLAMGFFCTFDPTFDEADGICVAILPDFATKTHATALRIDLLPNSTAGAGPASAVIDVIPGQATNYLARLNRDLFLPPTFWKGVGANTNPSDLTQVRWQGIAVNNCFAKCASWHPTSMNVNAAPAQTVPSTGSFSLTAASDISHFPDSGNLTVPIVASSPVTVTYTGRNDATQTFTGCRLKPPGGAGGSVDTATAIQLQDLSWSVELLVPTSAANGGADWADLSGHFGLYVNLFRVSQYLPTPPATPHAGFLAAQYRFPLPDASATDQQFLTGFMDDKLYIGEDWYGQATIVNVVGTNDAQGVGFQNVGNPASNVGVRHPGSPDPTTLGMYVYGNTGPYDNRLVAQVKNTNPTNAATNVSAEFRFGKWGNPPTAFAQWDPASAHGATTPTVIASLAAGGGMDEITSDWSRANVSTTPYVGDICMWVRLDSPDTVEFAQDGVRRNTIFTQLSEYSTDATISGSGYPPPTSGSHHDFVLMTHVRELVAAREGGDIARIADIAPAASAGGYEQVLGWYWLIESFRRTGLEFTVGKTTMEVIDPRPGEFGAFARHAGQPGDVFIGELSGGGLTRNGTILELKVPHNGEVTLQAWMGAGPAGTLKPPPPPPPADGGGGCLAQLLPFLKRVRNP